MPLNTEGQAEDNRSSLKKHYRIPVVEWALSFALMSVFHAPEPGNRVTLIPQTSQTISSEPGDWHIPATHFEYFDSLGSAHWLVMALMASLAIAVLTRRFASLWGEGASILIMAALSIGLRDIHFVPSIILGLLICLFAVSKQTHTAIAGLLLAILLSVTILTSLEIGFVLLFWGTLVLPFFLIKKSDEKRSRNLNWSSFLCLVVLLCGCFHSGFCATLCRPINWWNIGIYPGLLDSLRPSFSLELLSVKNNLLLCTIFACWILTLKSPDRFKQNGLCLTIFTLLGVGCSYYLWLSTTAMVLCMVAPCHHLLQASPPRFHRRYLLVKLFLMVLSITMLTGSGSFLRVYATQGVIPVHRIDPNEWRSGGGVLLVDLDRSSVWQNPVLAAKYQLVIDDRWELYGSDYPEYAALVRDLNEMRALVYFRTDQKFGGYLHHMKPWNPSLLVADSSDSQSIRNLSLSPHWKMMSVDSVYTYFGRVGIPENQRQIQKSAQAFLEMEWPTTQFQIDPIQSIAASFPGDKTRVSEILSAIRLPYAALRFLPAADSLQKQKVKAWSYLELAHRVLRNTGHHSLLDESRASLLIDDLENQEQWTLSELAVLRQSLEGLQGSSSVEHLGERSASNDQSAEEKLRKKLRLGQLAAAENTLNQVGAEIRPFYASLLTTQNDSLEDKAKSFYEISQNHNLTPLLKSELLFYVGCLAIEIGDPEVAIQTLNESEAVFPRSALTPIRATYIQQLKRQ